MTQPIPTPKAQQLVKDLENATKTVQANLSQDGLSEVTQSITLSWVEWMGLQFNQYGFTGFFKTLAVFAKHQNWAAFVSIANAQVKLLQQLLEE